MVKPRKTISRLKEKQLLQEVDTQCPFCGDGDVATFEFHHMDGDPSNDDINNLILVCSSCHTRITKGVISPADVDTKKRELYWTSRSRRTNERTGVNVSIVDSSFRGDIAQNITKISGVKAPKIAHPAGSIGANLALKGYVDYLIDQYAECRKADGSYGRPAPSSREVHQILHKNIQSKLGARTFFLPESRFSDLVAHLTKRIDNTIQGRRNSKAGIPNYHSFEEHCRKHNL